MPQNAVSPQDAHMSLRSAHEKLFTDAKKLLRGTLIAGAASEAVESVNTIICNKFKLMRMPVIITGLARSKDEVGESTKENLGKKDKLPPLCIKCVK